MNYGRYLVVLIAAFFLMIPAFSMPDDGHSTGCSDNQQKTFNNQNSMMGPDGHQQIGPKSMMGNDGPKIVCLTICKVIGGQEQAGTKSMMGGNVQDGKDKTCGCQAGQEQAAPRSMMGGNVQDGKDKTCGCQAGQEQAAPRSMMGGNVQDGKDRICSCQNAVSGDQGQDGQQKTSHHRSMKGQDGQQNSWNGGQKSWNANSKQDGQENTNDSQ